MPYAYVPGVRLSDFPLCILTSKSTASAAEAFTNIMKHLRDNTLIVGETTAGAENPVEHLHLFDDDVLRIPCWKKVYSYDGAIDGVNAIHHPVVVPEGILQSYGGKYGNRRIFYQDGTLYYQYKGRTKRKMCAISNEYFTVEGYDFFRVKFHVGNGNVSTMAEIYDDGTISKLIKE
jgi:hypothetical protein